MDIKDSKNWAVWAIVVFSLALVFMPFQRATTAAEQKSTDLKKQLERKEKPSMMPAKTESQGQRAAASGTQLASLSLDEPFFYNPKGRIDPFKPFLLKMLARGKRGKKLLPLTPLQKLSYVELQRGLVAIVWGHLGNRALIQDPAGKGYIIKPGTPVGPNGVVKQILSDRVIIEQKIVDLATNKTVRKEITLTLKRGEKGEI